MPLPLIHVFVDDPFRQWGLDFIGEIQPLSSGKHKWILTTTNFFTKWVEAIPSRNATDTMVIKFKEENILARFGWPKKMLLIMHMYSNQQNLLVFVKIMILSWENLLLITHKGTY